MARRRSDCRSCKGNGHSQQTGANCHQTEGVLGTGNNLEELLGKNKDKKKYKKVDKTDHIRKIQEYNASKTTNSRYCS